ncbi:MAG: HAD-IIIA family hydrolase [Phycisphaerales bacterium]
MRTRPAVFLDRDDTLNRNADLPDAAWGHRTPGDLLDPAFVALIPGAHDACRALKRAGYALVVVTNQGGVARGGGSLADVDACNDRLRELLTPDDAPIDTSIPPALRPTLIDAFYAAPHHPRGVVPPFNEESRWRKPNPGMIESACAELALDPARSWAVGDKRRDLDAAVAAGIPPDRCLMVGPDAEFPDLASAARRIIAANKPKGPTTTVTLRARDARPLADARTKETVLATARAIAERTGIELTDLAATDSSVTATLAASRLAALGFLAELRRLTNAWSHAKLDQALWPAADPD